MFIHVLYIRTFNIFQVYQYFTIYSWYFVLKFEYLVQYCLKSGDTKYQFKWVKVPGKHPLLKGPI